MDTFINPPRGEWDKLCCRPSQDNSLVRERVQKILERVRKDGDEALRQLSEEIDNTILGSIEVSNEEKSAAAIILSEDVKTAISCAAKNIKAFHQAQLPSRIELETAPGVKCIQKPVPISRVGLYIPGGTAPLFSSVLMLAIPAKIAGCNEVILCTPCGKDGKIAPAVLYAAVFCGIDHIYKLGGAQAIAAMAFGTLSIPKVDKIFGPGNQYVTTAKQLLAAGTVAIDMPAGPSEVMVIADSSTEPSFAAADLLSQAEHGKDSQVMLVCDKLETAQAIQDEVDRQKQELPRSSFVEGALSKSRTIILDSQAEAIDFANQYAPEHLIISTDEPWLVADKITAAGSVFIGKFTPESAGDYASGTNHTLPTCAWARSFSGVNIDSFIRKMTIQEITKEGLKNLGGTIVTMARAEGLQAHANAVRIRIDE